MESTEVIRGVELMARALELFGVAVVAVAFIYGTIRALFHCKQRDPHAYQRLKIFVGRGLQLGLEFLVAADIISTITIDPNREAIVSLGLLIIVRTLLSWSITMEMEGCWPWQVARVEKD